MKTDLQPQRHFEAAPRNGSTRRLVIAFEGDREVYRDQVNTDDDRDRRRYLRRLEQVTNAEADSLSDLATDLISAADAADEQLVEALENGAAASESANQATQIVNLVEEQDGFEFFKDLKGNPHVTYPHKGNHETARTKDPNFRRWISQLFFESTGSVPSSQALSDAIGMLEALAIFRGEEHEVYLRVGERDGDIYIDLADPERRAVRVSPEGWSIVNDPPVRFRRVRGMRPLPSPESGQIEELRRFLNTREEDWPLIVAWLVAALVSRGPYAILVLSGEHGTAKSTASRVLRRLVDPSRPENRTLPRDTRDLMIAADNCWIQSFDNVSSLSAEMSDALCRLATGAGFRTRELYTDSGEYVVDAMRAVILNGIGDFVVRGDLTERSMQIVLEPIADSRRVSERNFWRDFEEAHPRVFGGLLSVLSDALRNLPGIHLAVHPRMADFAELAVAAEPAMGVAPGAFLDRYMRNHQSQDEVALEASLIGPLLIGLVRRLGAWDGTATELLELLNGEVSESTRNQREWPETAQVLGQRLHGIAPNLRRSGVQVNFTRSGTRRIWLSRNADESAAGTPGGEGVAAGEAAAAAPAAQRPPGTTPHQPSGSTSSRGGAHGPSHGAPPSDPRQRPDGGVGPANTDPHAAREGWREERL